MEKSHRQNTSSLIKKLASAAVLSMGLLSGFSLIACGGDTTAPPADANAKITLTGPKGGQSFKVGDSLVVTWTYKADDPDAVNAVDPQISLDGGMNWAFLRREGSIPPASVLWGRFAWKITPTVALVSGASVSSVSNNVLVRVEQYSTHDETKISTTKSAITITAP
jgi:hypothetical protein